MFQVWCLEKLVDKLCQHLYIRAKTMALSKRSCEDNGLLGVHAKTTAFSGRSGADNDTLGTCAKTMMLHGHLFGCNVSGPNNNCQLDYGSFSLNNSDFLKTKRVGLMSPGTKLVASPFMFLTSKARFRELHRDSTDHCSSQLFWPPTKSVSNLPPSSLDTSAILACPYGIATPRRMAPLGCL